MKKALCWLGAAAIGCCVFGFTISACESESSESTGQSYSEENNYVFEFDRKLNGYVVTGLTDEFEGMVVDIPARHKGKFGEKSVVAVQSQAFFNREKITKAIFPDTVTTIKIGDYEGNDQGRIFSGCTALETVIMAGMLQLDGVLNFYNCVNLKEIVVNKSLKVKGSQFYVSGDFVEYVPKLDVFIDGNLRDAEFSCRRDENLSSNLMLTGNYYYYDRENSCNTWKYDSDGTPIVGKTHRYDARGECIECGALDPQGINYFYYEKLDSYVVDGVNVAFDGTEVNVKENFDDGINGYKAVKGINTKAFCGCEKLTKIILPSTLTEVVGTGGSIFERCHAAEYISMTGLSGFKKDYGGGNNFLDCISLKTLIVNKDFRNEVQTFYVRTNKHKDYVAQLDVYINAESKGSNFNAENNEFLNNNMFSGEQYLYKGTEPNQQEMLRAKWWHWVDGKPTSW